MRTADRRQDVIILEIVNSDFLLILPFCFDHIAIPITYLSHLIIVIFRATYHLDVHYPLLEICGV
jgi:hypothetical protein